MSIATVLEIAIGVLAVWIVVSFITVLIQPWISSRLRKQASDLELAIQRMLAHPLLVAQFYSHPIIRSLTADKGKLPASIPAQQFAFALFDILLNTGTESFLLGLGILKVRDDIQNEKVRDIPDRVIDELNMLVEFARDAAATESGTTITNRTLEMLKREISKLSEEYPQLYPLMTKVIEETEERREELYRLLKAQRISPTEYSALAKLRRGVAALSVINPQLSQTLNALMMNVEEYVTPRETSLGRAKKNVERWFDDCISIKSDDLKRYSQALALATGFLLAFLLNIDTLSMAMYLWRDAALRETLVQNSATFVKAEQNQKAIEDFSLQLVSLNLPFGWNISKSTGAAYQDTNCQLFPRAGMAFGIPLFVSRSCLAPSQLDNQTNILLKLVGILITAFAARQGAPYWFELLKVMLSLPRPGAKAAA